MKYFYISIFLMMFCIILSPSIWPQEIINIPESSRQEKMTQTLSAQNVLIPQGKGSIDKYFLRNGKVNNLSIPLETVSGKKIDIDEGTAKQLAIKRAEYFWGVTPQIGSIVPITNSLGEIVAYDVDLTLSRGSWKNYENIAQDWQRILNNQDEIKKSKPTQKEQRSVNQIFNEIGGVNHDYASVTISATYDAFPIRSARRGVSNFYSSGWVAKEIAINNLGDINPKLTTVYYLGPWERAYKFEGNGKWVIVEGQEPWNWYNTNEYYEVSAKNAIDRKTEIFQMIIKAGRDPLLLIDSVRTDNKKEVAKIISSSLLSPQSNVFITGGAQPSETVFERFEWHFGCTPTAAGMVFNYYDLNSWYGKLNFKYYREYDNIEGDQDCHVGDIQYGMKNFMYTDATGGTSPGDIYTGMKNFANAQGYSFSGGPDWVGSILGWSWPDIVNEINAGYPFVFSATAYPLPWGGTGGHSVAAVGYDDVAQDLWVYTTWSTNGNTVQRVHYSFGILDFTYGDGPHPGGPIYYDAKLTSHNGNTTFASCGSSGSILGGSSSTITWNNYGIPGDHVNLYYSSNGGVNWNYIASPPDNGSYSWPVPNISTTQARILIQQFSTSTTFVSSDGSYGDFTIQYVPPVSVTVQTSPTGRSFTVDGISYSTTQTFSWTSGSSHTIATTTPQSGGTGIQYVYSSWSDGGAISHSVSPTSNMTYTANFTTQYYLTMNAGTGGTVTPASGWYNSGQNVQISASANSGYMFYVWTGSGTGSYTGSNNPASVTMNGPITETPSFVQLISVTIQTSPTGRSIIVDGNSYTAPRTFSWVSGSSHSINTTTPQSGGTGIQYVWSSWSDGGAISHSVAPTSNTTYTANFTTQYYLTMNAGTGGTVSPASAYYNSGQSVQISASTNSGYSFSSWSGSGSGSYSGTSNPVNVTMNGPITETANFTQNPISVTVQTSPTGRSFTVDGTSYSTTQTFSWVSGSSHTIATTTPQSGGTGIQYVYSSWSDGGAISHSVSPTSNTTYTANFTTQYYLTMNAGTGGTVSPASAYYNSGQSVQISASANSGYSFSSWSGSGSGSYSGTSNPVNVTMNGPITETANFTQNPTNVQVTIQTNPSAPIFRVDGVPYIGSQLFIWESGSTHTISAPDTFPSYIDTRLVLTGWSDGKEPNHTIAPTTDSVFTAYYKTQYYLNMFTTGTTYCFVSPGSGWYPEDSCLQIYAPSLCSNPGFDQYFLGGWAGTGDGSYTGVSNEATICMSGPITERADYLDCKIVYVAADTMFDSNGGVGNLFAALQRDCNWSAMVDVPWIKLPYTYPPGLGTISFEVDPNPSDEDRIGQIMLYSSGGSSPADTTVRIHQKGQLTSIIVTISTDPNGPSFTVDDTTYTNTHTFSWLSGSSHTISADTMYQPPSSPNYIWRNWSDNGLRTHEIAPTTDTVFTATYKPYYYLTMDFGDIMPYCGGTPPSGWYPKDTCLEINSGGCYTSYPHYFHEWIGTGEGSYSGTQNPAIICMQSNITETAVIRWCYYSATSFPATYPPSGGRGSINLSTPSSTCGWQVDYLSSWIRIWQIFPSGAGSWTILIDVDPNSDIISRRGMVGIRFSTMSWLWVSIFQSADCLTPWTVTNTGNNHTIIIDTSSRPNISGTNISNGDFLGVFYDSSGTLACGGYQVWTGTDNITISAFGDDPTTPAKDGFAEGEEFKWKIFKCVGHTAYDAKASYVPPGVIISHTNLYTANGISQLASLVGGFVTQTNNLRSGWSIISSYIDPLRTELDSVFKDARSCVIIAKNGAGNSYIPSIPVNTIGPWVNTEGYKIKMSCLDTLNITGLKVIPESTPINIPIGWSIISYLRDSEMSIVAALSSIISDIIIVKDQNGNTYIPLLSINTIGNLKAGQGYQIKMSATQLLTYPANATLIATTETAENIKSASKNPEHYLLTNITDNNATLAIPAKAVAGIMQEGDEIGVFDEQGILIGSGIYTGDNFSIAVWGDDKTTAEQDGITDGQKFTLRIWDKKAGIEKQASKVAWQAGNGVYETNSISILEKLEISESQVNIPTRFEVMQNYPNPFNPTTKIYFTIPEETNVRITIFNMLGEVVVELLNRHLKAGYHDVVFNSQAYPTGVYYYKINAGSYTDIKKMVLIK